MKPIVFTSPVLSQFIHGTPHANRSDCCILQMKHLVSLENNCHNKNDHFRRTSANLYTDKYTHTLFTINLLLKPPLLSGFCASMLQKSVWTKFLHAFNWWQWIWCCIKQEICYQIKTLKSKWKKKSRLLWCLLWKQTYRHMFNTRNSKSPNQYSVRNNKRHWKVLSH